MLNDNQVWENSTYIIKIEALGQDFRGIIFRKLDSGMLLFIDILIEDHIHIYHTMPSPESLKK